MTPARSDTRSSRWLLVTAAMIVLAGLSFQFFGDDTPPAPEPAEVAGARPQTALAAAERAIEGSAVRRDRSLPFTPRATPINRRSDSSTAELIAEIENFHAKLADYRIDHPIDEFLELYREMVTPAALDGETARLRLMEEIELLGAEAVELEVSDDSQVASERIDATVRLWFSELTSRSAELVDAGIVELDADERRRFESLILKLDSIDPPDVEMANPFPQETLAHLRYENDLKNAVTTVAGILSEVLVALPAELHAERARLEERCEALDDDSEVPTVDPFQQALRDEWNSVSDAVGAYWSSRRKN